MQKTTLETCINTIFAICVVGCPFLTVSAYRAWVKSRSQNLSQRRTILGLTSLSLTFFNWLAFIMIIILGRTNVRVGVGVDLFLDVWAPIGVLMALGSIALAFAVTGMARIQGGAAALLMAAIWVIGILGGRN